MDRESLLLAASIMPRVRVYHCAEIGFGSDYLKVNIGECGSAN
jgi:hypothetical protein